MKQHSYQAQQLASLLKSLSNQKFTGVLSLKAQINSQEARSRVIVFFNGGISYGGKKLPNSEEFALKLGQEFNPKMINAALNFAKEKVENPNSVRMLLDKLIKVRTFTWEQVISLVHAQLVWQLEQTLPYPGEYHLEPGDSFDLCYEKGCQTLDLVKILSDVASRQESWASLTPTISSMEAVPQLPQSVEMSNPSVRQHLQQWVDGRRSLVDIAEGLDKDPLKIADSYLKWAQMGLVVFDDNHHSVQNQRQEKATILSVDDSPIVQETIKQMLGDRYNLLLADNAVDALDLLNRKDISLLLLDVTMPDVDGLEMCRALRGIAKFRTLPVIMLTARDGFADKLRGKIAGTNHYLTKPLDPKKLIELIEKYLSKNE